MASRTAVLTILVVVSLVFAGHVKGEQPGGSNQGQEPVAVAVAGGVHRSECKDMRLYKGPCIEAFCTAACLLQMHQGGHCRGSFLKGTCNCFWCS